MRSGEWIKVAGAVLIAAMLGAGSRLLADAAVPVSASLAPASTLSASGGQPAATVIDPVSPLLAKADSSHGQSLAQICSACHSFQKNGPSKVGPNLWGVVGSPHAAKDYPYSAAMKALPGVWDYESLNRFLYKPMDYVPGTKMSFAGLRKAGDRADVIAWLRTQSDAPVPLP